MYLTSRAPWIISLSHDVFSCTSMIPFKKHLAALIMICQYMKTTSAVVFWWEIAVIEPLAFILAFNIQTCTGACWWDSELVTANMISSSIFFG